jgi:hypothetical protein
MHTCGPEKRWVVGWEAHCEEIEEMGREVYCSKNLIPDLALEAGKS